MTLERFVESRRERWSELERLIAAARRRGLRSLSASEIERLGALYRRV
ncbi:stage II sporulation protein M, partial [Candidatus Poribacteria bacterium]